MIIHAGDQDGVEIRLALQMGTQSLRLRVSGVCAVIQNRVLRRFLFRGLKQFVVTDKKGHSHQQHQDKGETLVQLTALTAGGTGSGHTKQLLRGFT